MLFFWLCYVAPGKIVYCAKNYDAEFQKVLLLHHKRSSLPTPGTWWQSPPLASFKLNVDGAVNLNSGLHGVGVVVRDSSGQLCGAVAMQAPSLLSVLATELFALAVRISFAVDASFLLLIIEYDSLIAIQLLLKEETCYAAKGVIIEEIQHLLSSTPPYFIRFVPRTANGVANLLARSSLCQEDLSF
ncbi:uncharacterized protein LOC117618078 [Prunus dulcis]|uniref:uncharacterized protein LOC117618078 n=1 Tax=Prunus dulcis TaxID=3755 RepID=UPI0014836726|nr:uncharacterized protein LOC117618078 [Prunus dulcis]